MSTMYSGLVCKILKFYATACQPYYTRTSSTVTLSNFPGPRGENFRGFFVQARMVADDTTRVGSFGVVDATNSRLSNCPTTTVRYAYNTLLIAIYTHKAGSQCDARPCVALICETNISN